MRKFGLVIGFQHTIFDPPFLHRSPRRGDNVKTFVYYRRTRCSVGLPSYYLEEDTGVLKFFLDGLTIKILPVACY